MWFEQLTGFEELSPSNVMENLLIKEGKLISLINSKEFSIGTLEIPTLEELRTNSYVQEKYNSKIQISEIVADVRDLHCQKENENALFQVASQFNLLEMIDPCISPEMGVGRYEFDGTQGPVCAISCGAGTIYRNYFVPINEQIGQTEEKQIDCLELIGKELENDRLALWNMKNGYALLNKHGLLHINKKLAQCTENEIENLKGKLKIGIQWQTEVTLSESRHKVSQIYCSALPVAYSQIESIYWERFSRVILEGLYEATLYAGMINMEKFNSNVVYLTLVGGGAFGNEEFWILESLEKAVEKFKNVPLDLKIVSYGRSNDNLRKYFEIN